MITHLLSAKWPEVWPVSESKQSCSFCRERRKWRETTLDWWFWSWKLSECSRRERKKGSLQETHVSTTFVIDDDNDNVTVMIIDSTVQFFVFECLKIMICTNVFYLFSLQGSGCQVYLVTNDKLADAPVLKFQTPAHGEYQIEWMFLNSF